MTREEAIKILADLTDNFFLHTWEEQYKALHMAIEALSADAVSREEAIQAIDRCRERKNKEIEQLREFYSQKPTIPTFAESEEAYKAWTGEEMGKTGDVINEMNKEIIKDILKMMPTAYLLEALGVDTFEELTEQADRPHGEWIHDTHYGANLPEHRCSICGVWEYSDEESNYCSNCGAYNGGDGE